MYFIFFPDGTVKQIMGVEEEDLDIIREYKDKPECTVLKVEGDLGVVLEGTDWIEVPREYV